MKQTSSYLLKATYFILLIGVVIFLTPKKAHRVGTLNNTLATEHTSPQVSKTTRCINDSVYVETVVRLR